MNPSALLARLKERWQALSQTHKIITVAVLTGVLIGMIYLGQIAARPSLAPLFTGLDPKEAGAIVEKLKAMKVRYEMADQGKTIMVPEKQVYEARIQLASSGALGNGMGFELFDQSKLGVTDFEQQVVYQRALQEELRRTIVQLDGVEQARVHLVLPQKSVFINDQGTPSASVALKLKPGARLKPEQVQGVSDLIVGSIEGLKTENVHIIDTEANVLSDNLKSSDRNMVNPRITLDQQQAQRNYEKELEKRIQQMLGLILGQGKAVAMVTADLDFNQKQTTRNTATNPDGVIVSQQTIKETGTGPGDAGGLAGTDSNLVPNNPFSQGGGSSGYNREQITTNYQVSTVQETVVNAPGSVRRLSAAVVVNDGAVPADVPKIREVVSAAIGYDASRGDQISVSGMAFDTSYQDKINAEMARAEEAAKRMENMYKYALAGGAVLLVLALAAFAIRRRRSALRFEEEEEIIEQEEFLAVKELEEDPIRTEREEKQKRLKDLAREKPEDIAEIIKLWMKGT